MPKTIKQVQDFVERELPMENGFVLLTTDRKGEITMRWRAFHPEGNDIFRAMAAILVRHPKGAEFIKHMEEEKAESATPPEERS